MDVLEGPGAAEGAATVADDGFEDDGLMMSFLFLDPAGTDVDVEGG